MLRASVTIACLIALALSAGAAAAAEELFTENVGQAIAKAGKEGKDLYFHFTGSDWCGWCKKLESEVYDHKPFQDMVPTHFVLVKLDFPRRREMPAEVKQQNARWKTKFNVTGFPTIYLTDAAAKRPYAKTGYRRGGPKEYVKHLGDLRKIRKTRDAAMEKAKLAKGIARAKHLDAALTPMDEAIVLGFYQDEVKEIIKLDADGKAGLKDKYQSKLAAHQLSTDVTAKLRKRDIDGALQTIDEGLAKLKLTGEPAQKMLFLKAQLQFRKDRAAAKATLEKALAAAPTSKTAERIRSVLKQVFGPKPGSK